MKEIACRLNAYIQKHPFDSGDSDCETVLDQVYRAYAHLAMSSTVIIIFAASDISLIHTATPATV